jgi:hypothetical protein
MVSAWGCEQRLVLAQIATDAKSNEITAVPKLLEMLRLKGTIVTADALNCQRAIAQQIVDQGGDYALALKGWRQSLQSFRLPETRRDECPSLPSAFMAAAGSALIGWNCCDRNCISFSSGGEGLGDIIIRTDVELKYVFQRPISRTGHLRELQCD